MDLDHLRERQNGKIFEGLKIYRSKRKREGFWGAKGVVKTTQEWYWWKIETIIAS